MDSPVAVVMLALAVALAPFILAVLTSFAKIAIVLALLRSALGVQELPPNWVVTGLAVVLTLFIMAPVGEDVAGAVSPWIAAGAHPGRGPDAFVETSGEALRLAAEPVRRFLRAHSREGDRKRFAELAARLRSSHSSDAASSRRVQPQPESLPQDSARATRGDPFVVLALAFVTSELAEAFAIGFVLLLPFLVVDLVVANLLMALGMTSLSPQAVSLPVKLVLFVAVDGWQLILSGLVAGYA